MQTFSILYIHEQCENPTWLLPATAILHPDEIAVASPMGRIIEYRRDWAKGKDIPDEINKIDLCMLVDSGYTIEDEYAQWQYREGQIILNLNQPDSAPQITPPSPHQELGWRCAIERGSYGNPL